MITFFLSKEHPICHCVFQMSLLLQNNAADGVMFIVFPVVLIYFTEKMEVRNPYESYKWIFVLIAPDAPPCTDESL